jgi:hypothetical protein
MAKDVFDGRFRMTLNILSQSLGVDGGREVTFLGKREVTF